MRRKIDFKRLLAEISYINENFQNLRTYIVPDPRCQRIDLFYFVMFPADGSMADKPIVGKMFFINAYPANPPILHLFTLTQRFNVDVFYFGENSNYPHSSMCFDILERRTDNTPHGIWTSSITLSAVFASLLQAIVSIKVPQKYGGEIVEYVTMEKMINQHLEAQNIWSRYASYFADCPQIKHILAKETKLRNCVQFASNKIPLLFQKGRRIYSSCGFELQNADFCVEIDLSDLDKLPHPQYKYNFVISFVLANTTTDLVGNNPNTILIRNGITGTAAKKLQNEEIQWFYHGKPLVDCKKLYITISNKQITMAVDRKGSKLVLGDTVLSYLTKAEIGSVSFREEFYFNVYVETKKDLLENGDCFFLYVNTENPVGYLHPGEHELENKTSSNNSKLDQKWEFFDEKIKSDFEIKKKEEEILNKKMSLLEINRPKPSESAMFWSKLDKSTLNSGNPIKQKQIQISSPVSENSSNLSRSELNDSNSLTYSEEYLSQVIYVGIDLGKSSMKIYHEVLSKFGDSDLMNRFDLKMYYGHVTLCYFADFSSRQDFHDFICQYSEDSLVNFDIAGYIFDAHALAFLVNSKTLRQNFFPEEKNLHITALLNHGTKPVYSNKLIEKYKRAPGHDKSIICKELTTPIRYTGRIKFYKCMKSEDNVQVIY